MLDGKAAVFMKRNETGKILPRKFTGLTAKEQRHIKKTVKHARNMLLMK